MDDLDANPARPGGGGLFHSLARLLQTIVAFTQTRLELFSTELSEEIHRGSAALAWMFVALLAAGFALWFIGLTVILVFWDDHRVLAAVCVSAAFVLIAIISWFGLRAHMNSKPRIFDATRTELAKDRDQLEARL